MSRNILLCGVGGQGTVLTSKLIAAAAMEKGLHVMSAETIGMAQRGGSVYGNVRIGDDVHSPLIGTGEADLLIGFEPGETVRMLPYLKEGGTVVTNSDAVKPASSSLKKMRYEGSDMTEYLKKTVDPESLIIVDGRRITKELGSPRVLNTVLLGAALSAGVLPVSKEDIECALKSTVKKSYIDINLKALRYCDEVINH
ncbi:MAG: indolepyruvate oxidoreductase subunit beta [Lachnospiraceae bacterium]|nr:indolepyruvate oxidoreductase subunit beta [Lachnospiraceae bacterium]